MPYFFCIFAVARMLYKATRWRIAPRQRSIEITAFVTWYKIENEISINYLKFV
jgi:hypothetical protein